jgi:hypothetical protein
MMADPSVEGVYESKIPLGFKMVCNFGNTVMPRKGAKIGAGQVWESDHLTSMKSNQSYLSHTKFNSVYIGLLKFKGRNSILSVCNRNLNEYHFIFVHRGLDNQNYSRIIKNLLKTDESDQRVSDAIIKTHNFDTEAQAFQFAEKIFGDTKSQKHSCNLVLYQGPKNICIQTLKQKGLKSLLQD